MRAALAAILFLAMTAAAQAQQAKPAPRIVGGYVSGKEYLDMDGMEKLAYLRGLLDGMFLAPAFGAANEDVDWLLACTGEVGIEDFRRHLFDYIRTRDELWPNRSPVKAFRAVRDLCALRAKK